MALCGLREGNSAISFPLDMPPVMDNIMFTMEIFVLGGAVLDGKTPLSEESFINTNPIE